MLIPILFLGTGTLMTGGVLYLDRTQQLKTHHELIYIITMVTLLVVGWYIDTPGVH